MRRMFVVVAAVFLAAGGVVNAAQAATPTPSPTASSDVAAIPLFTCVSSEYTLNTNAAGGPAAFFNNSVDRLEMSSNFTTFCGNKNNFSNEEIDITGTNDCLTYAGPKSGTAPFGYVDKKTCSNYASQQWTLYSNHLFKNAYVNSGYCLDGPQFNKYPFMEGCNTNDSGQFWSITTN